MGVIANMWQFVKPILDGLIKIILDVAKFIMQVATQDWPGAWQTIQDIVNHAWEAIKGFFVAFVNWVLQTFLGSNIKEFLDTWRRNFDLLGVIANTIINKVIGYFNNVLGVINNVIAAVSSLISWIGSIKFPKLPDYLIRKSPSPIEKAFGNWAEYAKEVKSTVNSITFPAMGQFGVQQASSNYDQRKEYHLHLATSQSTAVVQQSFDIMRVLEYGS
jgi:hypothetical protein